MDLQTVIYEKKGNVAWLTLNRPEVLNAINALMRQDLITALEEARDDKEVYVIAVTGAGEKAFCAGADISEFPRLTSLDQITERYGRLRPFTLFREIPKPTVAVVNGLALGGGCEVVLNCDLAIASETAQFGQPEIRVGVIPGAGGTQILPRLIGEKRAKELILTGRAITAQEAFQMGLINQVVPADKLREAADKFIEGLLRNSPAILRFAKLAVNRALETTLLTGLASERDIFSLCFSTEDQKEAAKAFLEKRRPSYKAR